MCDLALGYYQASPAGRPKANQTVEADTRPELVAAQPIETISARWPAGI